MPRARSGAGFSLLRSGGGGDDEDAAGARAGAHPFDAPEADRYEIGGELGQGGMGRVVAARDARLGRIVARKSVAGTAGATVEAERRFAREALITATLDHPSIVPILDAGRGPDGALFYTMRLVRGRTLGAALREAGSAAARRGLLRQFVLACEAVAYAHEQRVVHRDLKPDNILVGPFGEAQVVDWGLARRLDDGDDGAGPDPDGPPDPDGRAPAAPGPVTRAGVLVGTPAYMSPEQARGEVAGPASDVWSLGAVLYELIAGRAPIAAGATGSDPGAADEAVLAAARRGAIVPLLDVQPDAPPELAAIAGKALSPDPAARYPDARALAADLERFLDGQLVSAHRYSAREQLLRVVRAFRAPLTVAAAAAILLLATAGIAWKRLSAERDRAVFAHEAARRALAEADENLAASLTSQALSALADGGRPEAELLAARALRLADRPDARGVIAAFAHARRPRLLAQIPAPCEQPRPRGDGAVLCVRDGDVSLHAGAPPVERWRRAISARSAAFAAGGARVVALDERMEIHVLDAADGGGVARLGQAMPGGVVHGGGGPIAIVSNPAGAALVDVRRLTLRMTAPCGPGTIHAAAAASDDGSLVAVACTDGRVALFGPDEPEPRWRPTLTPDRRGPNAVALSPDGSLLVVTTLDGDAIIVDLRAGGGPVRTPLGLGEIREILFTPDGERVLLLGVRGGPALWDPRAQALPVRFAGDRDVHAAFSPSGDALHLGGATLRRFAPPDRLQPVRLRPERGAGIAGMAASPSGDEIALAIGDGRLVVLDAATGRARFTDRFQEGVLKGAQFSRGGDGLVAWAAGHPSLRRYDRAGRPLRTVDAGMLRRAAELASGWLVAATYGRGARLVPPAGVADTTPPRHIGERTMLDSSLSDDGRTLLLLAEDGAVFRVDDGDPPSGRPLLARRGARAIALSGDARLLALADARGLELFDAGDGASRGRCDAGELRILDVALSSDGRLAAAGDLDGGVRVFTTSDGALRALLRGHDERVSSVAFTGGDRLLVSASWDGTARLFDLRVLDRPAAALAAEVEAAWDGVAATPPAQGVSAKQ